MAKLTRLGDLERAVMDHLWSTPEPQTVRQVHEALSARRNLAYTTIVSVLAFTLLAVLLVGPAPALLARATWPLRAPRAAMVLWQAVALAAVLSAFSAGIAIASRLLMPGPDGRPTASIIGAAGRLGWPLWAAYIAVFALTVLVGARLMVAVLRVAVANRRR